jgi:hypothetical protein
MPQLQLWKDSRVELYAILHDQGGGLSLGRDREVHLKGQLDTNRSSQDTLLPEFSPECVTKRRLLFDRLISCCIRRRRLSPRVCVLRNAMWNLCANLPSLCTPYGQTDTFVNAKSTCRYVKGQESYFAAMVKTRQHQVRATCGCGQCLLCVETLMHNNDR